MHGAYIRSASPALIDTISTRWIKQIKSHNINILYILCSFQSCVYVHAFFPERPSKQGELFKCKYNQIIIYSICKIYHKY